MNSSKNVHEVCTRSYFARVYCCCLFRIAGLLSMRSSVRVHIHANVDIDVLFMGIDVWVHVPPMFALTTEFLRACLHGFVWVGFFSEFVKWLLSYHARDTLVTFLAAKWNYKFSGKLCDALDDCYKLWDDRCMCSSARLCVSLMCESNTLGFNMAHHTRTAPLYPLTPFSWCTKTLSLPNRPYRFKGKRASIAQRWRDVATDKSEAERDAIKPTENNYNQNPVNEFWMRCLCDSLWIVSSHLHALGDEMIEKVLINVILSSIHTV